MTGGARGGGDVLFTVMRRLWILAVILAVAACGAPDRKADAGRLRNAITAMPGVAAVHVNYTNSFEQGRSLDIDVSLPTATPEQITDVVSRINEVRGDAFTGYQQSAQFSVAPERHLLVKRGADLDGVADDARALRSLSGDVGAADIDIFRSGPTPAAQLTVRNATKPAGDVFAAVRAAFGTAKLNLDLLPAPEAHLPIWAVSFPFSIADQQQVQHRIAGIALPVHAVTVDGGAAITSLTVVLRSPATADADLTSVIHTVGAGPGHPLSLSWLLDGQAAGEQQFTGSVDVAGCDYPGTVGEQQPEKYLTPAAVALQQRLRTEFDNCPR